MDNRRTQLVGVLLLSVLVLVGLWVYVQQQRGVPQAEVGSPEVVRFTQEMRNTVVAEIGQPIEGFEPFMFMQMYPGLMPQDFNDIEALIGVYRVQNDQIVYDPNGERELHSAARAISDKGMAQLYNNLLARMGRMQESDRVAGVLAAISQ